MKLQRLLLACTLVASMFILCSCPPGPKVDEDSCVLVGNCYGEKESSGGLGAGANATLGGATLIKGDKLTAAGTQIIGVRFRLDDVANGEIFVGEDLEAPTDVQSFTYEKGGWQYVLFENPVKINGNDLYVGFKATGNGYFLGHQQTAGARNTEYFYYNGKWGTFSSQTGGNGYVMVQAIVNGGNYDNMTQHDIVVENVIVPDYSTGGAEMTVSFEVRNAGVKSVSGVEASVKLGSSTVNYTIDKKLRNGQSAYVELNLNAPTTNFNGNITIEVPFAEDEKTSNNTVESEHRTFADAYTRNHIYVEQFTGQDCGYCPGGAKTLKEAIAGMKDPSKAIWVANHVGYAPDKLTVTGESLLTTPLGVRGAPSCDVDRVKVKYSNSDEPSIAWHPGYATSAILENCLLLPGLATVNINRTFNPATRELTVTVSGETKESALFVTCLVKQDGIVARQADYTNGTQQNYVHNNAPRVYLSSGVGDQVPVDGNGNYTKTYTWTVPAQVGDFECVLEDMDVVAFAHGEIYSSNRLVFNSEIVPLLQEVGAPSQVRRALVQENIYGSALSVCGGLIRGEVIE